MEVKGLIIRIFGSLSGFYTRITQLLTVLRVSHLFLSKKVGILDIPVEIVTGIVIFQVSFSVRYAVVRHWQLLVLGNVLKIIMQQLFLNLPLKIVQLREIFVFLTFIV